MWTFSLSLLDVTSCNSCRSSHSVLAPGASTLTYCQSLEREESHMDCLPYNMSLETYLCTYHCFSADVQNWCQYNHNDTAKNLSHKCRSSHNDGFY